MEAKVAQDAFAAFGRGDIQALLTNLAASIPHGLPEGTDIFTLR